MRIKLFNLVKGNWNYKTITIIRKVDKKGFTLIVMLSMIAGAFPVITLVLSQELINSIVKKSLETYWKMQ